MGFTVQFTGIQRSIDQAPSWIARSKTSILIEGRQNASLQTRYQTAGYTRLTDNGSNYIDWH